MRFLFSIILFILLSTIASAQNSPKLKDLERKRKAALEQIAGITKQLTLNKKDAANSMRRLKLIATQIESRKKLIQLLSDELAELETQINTLEKEIEVLEVELNQKKEEYGKSVQLMFRKRSAYDKLMFVFSSNSLSQAYRRTRYLKEYALWSREKGEEIMVQQAELTRKKTELQKNKADKETLVTMRQRESEKLKSEESKQKGVVKTLDKMRGELQTSLSKQKKQAQALNSQIQRIIQEEIRKAQAEARRQAEAEARRQKEEDDRRQRIAEDVSRKKAADAAAAAAASKAATTNAAKPTTSTSKSTTKPTNTVASQTAAPKTTEKPVYVEKPIPITPVAKVRKADSEGGYAMTREEKSLSDDFSKNRGSLPAPISGRFKIVGRYGLQQHEDLKYVVTNNNGVDIKTDPGADARCVFNGVVSKVFAVPGYNSSIIIRHGNYLSVYSNLSRVYVSAGDRVSTRQAIGKVYTDADFDNQTILHFEIRKEIATQNPESWVNF